MVNGFKVTLFKEKIVANFNVIDKVPDKVPDNVPERRMVLILDLMKQNNKILLLELSEILKVSKRTIRRDIEKLKLENKLKRVGNEKSGHWRIIDKPVQDETH